MDKPELRREAMRRRDSLPEREARGALIVARLTALPLYASARTIHCYLSMRSEVDTRAVITDALARGKGVVVPVVEPGSDELHHTRLDTVAPEAFEEGVFGTRHPRNARPVALGDWDLTIVPLLAFDRRGFRLGYGKGFYDRLLARIAAPSVGIAFAAQEFDAVPVEPHDVPLPWIVTEQEVIVTRPDPAA